MSKCPNCFSEISPTTYTWLCESPRCDVGVDEQASLYAGASVSTGRIAQLTKPAEAGRGWAPPNPATCAECSQNLVDACSVCHYRLEEGWRDADVICIAMSGARATGKSLYIASAVKQLQRFALAQRVTVQYANDKTAEVFRKVYEEPLFEARGLIPPTPPSGTENAYQRDPLVFGFGSVKGRKRIIAIRDVAGEEMERPPAGALHLSFLARADAIFFLFDPLAVPNIRDRLVDLLPAQQRAGGDPTVVLGNLLRLIGTASPRLGVLVSKFDALQELRNVDDVEWKLMMSNPGATYLQDSSSTDLDSPDDGLMLHEEVRSLLTKLGGQQIIVTLENAHGGRPMDYRMFAVSALGASPDGAGINPHGIAPFRPLDPLKWVLRSRQWI